MCAIVEVSSGWNPSLREWEPERWLLANHPNDFRGGEEEYIALGTRWGLMQFMGSRLREMEWKGPFTAELGEPEMNLKAGCFILRRLLDSGSKNILIHYYGIERRRMADLTLKLLPVFERFVQERPAVGTRLSDSRPVPSP